MKAFVATASAIGLLLIVAVSSIVSVNNRFGRLEVRAEAAQLDNKNVLDNTRKSVREAAAVSDKEVEALVSIITGYADSRGKNPAEGGAGNIVSMAMVTEAVPQLTEVKTLTRLQNILTAARADWQNAQTRLIDIKREADTMFATWPSGAILGMLGKEKFDITVVTSAETDANFATGKDESSWVE